MRAANQAFATRMKRRRSNQPKRSRITDVSEAEAALQLNCSAPQRIPRYTKIGIH
jgi:hypothetical protein